MFKNGGVKIVDSERVRDLLLADGWAVAGDEREALFEKAKALGLKPHHNAGIEKLKEMLK